MVTDINHFHARGNGFCYSYALLQNNLIHEDVNTILGNMDSKKFTQEPKIINHKIQWVQGQKFSLNTEIITPPLDKPFNSQSGLKIMKGNVGRGVIKTSSLKNPEFQIVKAYCIVFNEARRFN